MRKLCAKCVEFWRNDKAGSFIRGSAGSFVLRVGGVGLRFTAGVLLARLLGVAAYGRYAFAITWLTVLSIPAMLGLDHILIRFVASYSEKKKWGHLRALLRFSWKLGLGSSLLTGGAAVLFLFWRVDLPSETRLTLGITLAGVPVFVISQIQQSMLRGLQRPSLAQLPEQIFYPVILLLFVSGIWLFSVGISSPVAAGINVGSWLAAVLLGAYWVHRNVPEDVRSATAVSEKSEWGAMIPDLLFFNVAYQLMSRTPTLALGILGSSRDVGVYSVCTRGAEFAEFIYCAVTLAGAPFFSRLFARGDKAELQRFATLASRTILWVSLPIFVGLFLITPTFLRLYGPEFVTGVGIMRLLLVIFFLNSVCGFVDVMLIVTGHQRLIAKVMGMLALLNFGLCWALIPRFGLAGAALASSVCVLAFKGALVWFVHKRIGIVSLPFGPGPSLQLIKTFWANA